MKKAKNLSVNQLSLKAGLKVSHIVRLENGETQDPKFYIVKILSKALGDLLACFDDNSNDETETEAISHLWENNIDAQLMD